MAEGCVITIYECGPTKSQKSEQYKARVTWAQGRQSQVLYWPAVIPLDEFLRALADEIERFKIEGPYVSNTNHKEGALTE